MTDLIPVDADMSVMTVEQAQAAVQRYREITRGALGADDWQGPPGEPGSFIKKQGWQTIAKAYRVSTSVIDDVAEYDDDGVIIRSRAKVRAVDPDGRSREATGYCSIHEPGRRSSPKLEHDLRATAVTRAENRAISNLAGIGQVSAEEAGPAAEEGHTNGASGEPLPRWARPAPDVANVADWLATILQQAGAPTAAITAIGSTIFDSCDQTIPVCVADLLAMLADVVAAEPIPDVQPEG